MCWKAQGYTLLLTVISMVIAIVLAVVLAVMRNHQPSASWRELVHIWFFRGTPVYTQLVFWGLFAVLIPVSVSAFHLPIDSGVDCSPSSPHSTRRGSVWR